MGQEVERRIRALTERATVLSWPSRYGIATAAIGAAGWFRALIDPIWGHAFPFITFYPAVVLSAWLGGFWPGVWAAGLAATFTVYALMPPFAPPTLAGAGNLIGLAVFVVMSVFISALNEAWRRATMAAARSERRLRQAEQERTALIEREQAARTNAERIARDLHVAEQRVSQLVDSVPGVVWEAWGQPDASQQRIDFVSQYVETLLGYSVDEWLRTPNFWLTIVHPDDRERAARVAAATFARGGPHENQFRWIARDGRVLWVEARSAVVRDDDGRPAGMRGVTFDISERKAAETAVAQARREAERAARLKDQFLAMVSHELRTPLNAMLGWADMLRRHMVPEAQRERALASIYTNARRQGQLIDELLDVSRIISGKLSLERSSVDLHRAVAAAVEAVHTSAEAKRIRIATSVEPSLGALSADPNRLQQILGNLLSNAVKFTPNGGTILVGGSRVDAETVELHVTDTGKGISAEFLPWIFEPFRQEDSSSTRRHGGLGLGLAIAKHLVELHGGSIAASSPGDGQGATFRVRLHAPSGPATAASGVPEDAAAAGAASDPTAPSLEGLSVLVVDDDRESRDVLAAALAGHRAAVITAGSAADALEILNARVVDVVVSDVAMPDEDGYSLIRRIRALDRPRAARVPAVAVTSFAREEDRRLALQAGFHLHIAKPIDASSLAAAIRDLTHRA